MTTTGGAPQLADDVAPDPPDERPDTQGRVGDVLTRAAVPVGAVVAALLVGAVMLLALGANPIEGYWAMLVGAFGSGDALADTAIKAMPLLLVGETIGLLMSGVTPSDDRWRETDGPDPALDPDPGTGDDA